MNTRPKGKRFSPESSGLRRGKSRGRGVWNGGRTKPGKKKTLPLNLLARQRLLREEKLERKHRKNVHSLLKLTPQRSYAKVEKKSERRAPRVRARAPVSTLTADPEAINSSLLDLAKMPPPSGIRLSEAKKGRESPLAKAMSAPSRLRSASVTVPSNSAPKPRVCLLTGLSHLLNRVQPGSFVALDIDETLIVTRHTPSLLMGPLGVKRFQSFVNERFPDFESRNGHSRKLQRAIRDKILVESDTARVVAELQKRGCYVFGLTARYNDMQADTEQTLASLNIDMKLTSPLPRQPLQDPETEALMANGIIYCNGLDKGQVLDRFLANVVFRLALEKHREAEADGVAYDASSLGIGGFYFVDDRLDHILSVREGSATLRKLGIPTTCYHYRPPVALQAYEQRNLNVTRPDLLPFLMEHFVTTGQVLSNTEGIARLEADHSPMACGT